MKKLATIILPLALSGCISMQTNDRIHKEHDAESIPCVDNRTSMFKINQNGYKLVFFARNFYGTVNVWVHPKTSRTLVTRTKHMSSRTCNVFEGLPVTMYNTSYEMGTPIVN